VNDQEYKLRLEQAEKQRDILQEILQERLHQDEKWGGPEHDDEHKQGDWGEFLLFRAEDLAAERGDHRRLLIEVAALAVAAIESTDR